MPADDTRLARYDFYRGPQRLRELWTLSRDALLMRCALSTHRLGWELRLSSGSSFARTQVCRSEREVYEVSDAWRTEAIAKGWKAAPGAADAG